MEYSGQLFLIVGNSGWQNDLLFPRIRVLSVKYGDVTDHARQMASGSALKGPGYLGFLLFFFVIDKFDFN